MGIDPYLIFKSKKDHIIMDWISFQNTIKGNPFLVLREILDDFSIKDTDLPLPFIGGAVGYFSYDLKDFNERLVDRALDDTRLADSLLCLYDCIAAFDHLKQEFFVVSTGFPAKGRENLYRKKARMENLINTIKAADRMFIEEVPDLRFESAYSGTETVPKSNFTRNNYIKAVKAAKEYIKAGDIYQVNLSQRFKAKVDVKAFDLYAALRIINPAPFAAFLNFGDVKIISASPERFLKKESRSVQTRPIKGTRPRGKNKTDDIKLKKELLGSIKDRAENLMIIDLERNDLGRICEFGTVKVMEFMKCEEYATVFHLVSTIAGKLKKRTGAIDCLISCFPGGSITGAPKIRSMEIIEELEPVKRSIYTGSIGYISFNDNMDTSIAIRTLVMKGGDVYFHAGGGIVYDSEPEKEYQETLDKAKAMIEVTRLSGEVNPQLIKQRWHTA